MRRPMQLLYMREGEGGSQHRVCYTQLCMMCGAVCIVLFPCRTLFGQLQDVHTHTAYK